MPTTSHESAKGQHCRIVNPQVGIPDADAHHSRQLELYPNHPFQWDEEELQDAIAIKAKEDAS